jgi:hypothetical protein
MSEVAIHPRRTRENPKQRLFDVPQGSQHFEFGRV